MLFLGLIVFSPLRSQQDLQFTQFNFNKLIFNPAVAGTNDALDISAFYRAQWVGLNGNPEYQTITADMPVYRINSGIGVSFFSDRIGAENNLDIRLSYSYITSVGSSKLSFGVYGGIMQKSIDGTKLQAPQGLYEPQVINHNDDFIPVGKVSAFAPDAGLGVYIGNERYSAGLSVTGLLESTYDFQLDAQTTRITRKRHFYLSGSYLIPVSDNFTIIPSLLAKSDLVEHQIDINALLLYNEVIWAGVSYRGYNNRSQDAIAAMLGAQLTRNLKVGYSYDFGLSELKQVNSGSHELFINYIVPMKRPSAGKIINNPRFLSY